MAQITLDIADDKLDFFKELIDNLDFVKIPEEYLVPQEQQDIVMERLEEMQQNKANKLNWNAVKDSL